MNGPLPVFVLTGFLGSGKTTLLRHLLHDPAFADCAVLVNEFGEIGLDDALVTSLGEEVLLMPSGCLCCTLRGDLAVALRALYTRRERGELAFARVVIETTGLADPTPILATLLNEPQMRHHLRLGGVITTVDALLGESELDRQPESVKQAALADHLLITKADLATADALDRLEARLARLNPAARRWRSANAPPPARLLLVESAQIHRHFYAEAVASEGAETHEADIRSFTLDFAQGIDWNVFAVWFTLLLAAHGGNLLRVKGLLHVAGTTGPVLFNAVQHIVFPPEHLAGWPAGWAGSRLVFIVRGLQRAAIERSFTAFHGVLGQVGEPASL